MKRKVIDSNYLNRPELRQYLAASPKNKVVVTDYVELEMLRGNSMETFLRSTEILADYPRQVILAKTTGVAAGLRGKRKALKKRLTDGNRTSAFRKWCRVRRLIKNGERSFEHKRLKAREAALAHLERMLNNLTSFKDDLEGHADRYTNQELSIIRTHQPFTDALVAKLIDGIMDFVQGFFEARLNHRELPPSREVPYTFIFRFALCAYMHTLHWIAAGGARDRSLEKFRNDLIDVMVVAFGTCFDGVLTNDKLAAEIFSNATFLLESGFLKGRAAAAGKSTKVQISGLLTLSE